MSSTKLAEHAGGGGGRVRPGRRVIDRAVDVALAVLALCFVLPLFTLIALLITISDPGPVFARTRHVRIDGHPCRLLRFRTHRIGSDKFGQSSDHTSEDPGGRYSLKLGAALYHSGLEDLPMLINVARGDLPIVGRYTWRQVLAWLSSSTQ
jgi:lipopolysaccharide/colanic/teichoic acid biosynthesis glycosyltransferase